MATIGKSLNRIDVRDKVTGTALYPGDLTRPDMAFMKILFAQRPHAIVKHIDSSQAEAHPGVLGVFTAKDVPANEYGLIVPDQPVLCGPGSTKEFADRVRFVGDQVAVVVAETEAIAAEACELLQVTYEDLPVVTDAEQALEDTSVLIHPNQEDNVITHYRIRKGDVDSALEQADVVIEGEYYTPVQEHAYLQPEAGIAYIDDKGRVTVEVAGQWVHEEREQIAHALALPEEQVRVIHPAIGGAFGGREDLSVQIVLALAAWRLHQRGITRTVKIVWSREESIIGHHKRHEYLIRTRWGADKAGKILAAEVELIANGGAYTYTSGKVLGNATLMCTGPYEIPNVKVDAYAVYTNNVPGGAFRGFGGPQGAFAAESQMNKLAEALGIDSVEIRRRNVVREGSLLSVNSPLPKGVSMPQVVEKCAQAARWDNDEPRSSTEAHLQRGKGFACGFKNIGFSYGYPENSWATVELHGTGEIERVVVRHAAAEVGQGTHMAIVQMAAEAADVPIEKVELISADSAQTDNSGSVSASRMTFMAGNAVKGAAERALAKWQDEERPAIATFQYRPPATSPFDPETGECVPNFSYGYVAEAVELEVDTETGFIRLVDVVCANDVGKAINPQQVEGQIEGAIVQAAGYTILEKFIQEDGYVLTPHLSTYLIPGVLDVPDRVQSVVVEHPDPLGPWGARGMGEMPYIPLAPAITAALHDATGVWFDDFPLTPERVLEGLGKFN